MCLDKTVRLIKNFESEANFVRSHLPGTWHEQHIGTPPPSSTTDFKFTSYIYTQLDGFAGGRYLRLVRLVIYQRGGAT